MTHGERIKDRTLTAQTRRARRRTFALSRASEFVRASHEFTCYVNPCMVPRARADQLTAVVFIASSRFKARGSRPSSNGVSGARVSSTISTENPRGDLGFTERFAESGPRDFQATEDGFAEVSLTWRNREKTATAIELSRIKIRAKRNRS